MEGPGVRWPCRLVYSRIASFAARTAQALLLQHASAGGIAQGMLQLYVDDPALTLAGDHKQQRRAIDVFTLWLLVLGIPLSWSKGSYVDNKLGHSWVGVEFRCRAPGTCTMTVPEAFVQSLLPLALKFSTESTKAASLADAHALCGKAGRLSQVVPEARPFSQALFAALAASLRSKRGGGRECAPSKVATRRFRVAARWLVALLRRDQTAPFRLEHTVSVCREPFNPLQVRVEFDASPWGGGAVLFEKNEPTDFSRLPGRRPTTPTLVYAPACQLIRPFMSWLVWG